VTARLKMILKFGTMGISVVLAATPEASGVLDHLRKLQVRAVAAAPRKAWRFGR